MIYKNPQRYQVSLKLQKRYVMLFNRITPGGGPNCYKFVSFNVHNNPWKGVLEKFFVSFVITFV